MNKKEKKNLEVVKKENNLFCVSCGKKIGEDFVYCEHCGKKIKDIDDNIVVDEIEPAEIEENKKEESKSKKKHIKLIDFNKFMKSKFTAVILSCMITFAICMIFTVAYCTHYINAKNNEPTVKKNVTITDKGLADSVSKVYDSVVVVKTYVKGELYATGTGFVYKTDDKNGYILTNNHVIDGGTDIKVVFTDEKEKDVKVVGTDSYSDIALLKVDKSAVKGIAEVGSSKNMKVGDTTFAVGAPLDSTVYSWTVTRGILSGKNRLVEVSNSDSAFASSSDLMEVLQTDTAINSGNSGGPLCNADGQVIGITNMKISSSSVEGMGFAIPIENAIQYASKFMNGEVVVRPYLGISMYDMSNNMFSEDTTGIYVAAVENGSPAEKAGIQKGDIITKIGDKEVASSSYLKYELYKYSIGDKVKITYKRNNKEQSTTIALGSTSAS
jgi:serine protease Do